MLLSINYKWERILISTMLVVFLAVTSACAADKKDALSSFPYQGAQKLINQEEGGVCTFFGYFEGDTGRVSVYYIGPKGNQSESKSFILLMTEKGKRWFVTSRMDSNHVKPLE